jgi:hypothetical protein
MGLEITAAYTPRWKQHREHRLGNVCVPPSVHGPPNRFEALLAPPSENAVYGDSTGRQLHPPE